MVTLLAKVNASRLLKKRKPALTKAEERPRPCQDQARNVVEQ
jgi:hypothetical protein